MSVEFTSRNSAEHERCAFNPTVTSDADVELRYKGEYSGNRKGLFCTALLRLYLPKDEGTGLPPASGKRQTCKCLGELPTAGVTKIDTKGLSFDYEHCTSDSPTAPTQEGRSEKRRLPAHTIRHIPDR